MLTTQQKFGYAIGAYGLILFWSGASLFMLYYYTDVLLLKPETAGTIFLMAMIWDGVTDPVMGMIADRTRTRWGNTGPIYYSVRYLWQSVITSHFPNRSFLLRHW